MAFPVVPDGLFLFRFVLFCFYFSFFCSLARSCAAWNRASSSITLEMNWMMALCCVPENIYRSMQQCPMPNASGRERDNVSVCLCVRVSIYICVRCLCVVHKLCDETEDAFRSINATHTQSLTPWVESTRNKYTVRNMERWNTMKCGKFKYKWIDDLINYYHLI